MPEPWGSTADPPKDLWSLYLRAHPASPDASCPRRKKLSWTRRSTEHDYGRACRSPKQRTFATAAREKPHIRPAAPSAAAVTSRPCELHRHQRPVGGTAFEVEFLARDGSPCRLTLFVKGDRAIRTALTAASIVVYIPRVAGCIGPRARAAS